MTNRWLDPKFFSELAYTHIQHEQIHTDLINNHRESVRDQRSVWLVEGLEIITYHAAFAVLQYNAKNVWVIIISKRGGVLTALHVSLEAAVCHTVTVELHHPTMSKKSQGGRPTFSTPTHQKAAYSGNSHPTGVY